MNYDLVYPMAAMVLLTLFIIVSMFLGRVRAVKEGEATSGYYKTFQEGKEPRKAAQYSRQVSNIFETPNLFYIASVIGLVTGFYPAVMVVLAWVYVVLRGMHAYIHIGTNKLPPRIRVYATSLAVLLAMWATLCVGVMRVT